jgi:hypothetical protein
MDFDCSRRFANRQSCLQPYIYIFYVLDESILQPAQRNGCLLFALLVKTFFNFSHKSQSGEAEQDFYRVQGLWKRKSVLPYFLEQRISHAYYPRSFACDLFTIAQGQLLKTNPARSKFTCCYERAWRAVAKDQHEFHCRCNGLQVIRHCFDGLQRIPRTPRAQPMKNVSAGSCQISPKRSSFVKLRTLGGNGQSQGPASPPRICNRGHSMPGTRIHKEERSQKNAVTKNDNP